MAVNRYNFQSPNCRHAEHKSESVYLFSDNCFTILQCPKCHNIISKELMESQIANKDYPKCSECHTVLVDWDKTCPICNTPIALESWYSDAI